MIGRTITRKADKAKFTVVGSDAEARTWIVQPVDFGTPVSITPADLKAEFGVSAPDVTKPDNNWTGIADRFRQLTSRKPRATEGATPEEVFADEDAHVRVAAAVMQDEDRLAEFEAGLLPCHPAVALELDRLIAAEDRNGA